MIYGTGIDIARVSRFEKWYDKKQIVERYFHIDEVNYIYSLSREGALQSMAARFAAKEAFGKALGIGLKGFSLKNVSVERQKNGNPSLRIFGDAKIIIDNEGITKIHLSLSHEKEYAIAQVILEK
ncbi:MAG: holo-[acyl-carrier-protein] synthase [Treponema sp. CETP13]|nr:MAG: holo-[acyl-carrier-protein] synthase [Treponema sp. CETP13]